MKSESHEYIDKLREILSLAPLVRRAEKLRRPTDEERFWEKLERADGCWTWPYGGHPFGYGSTTFRGHRKLTHRLAWELTHGAVPPGLYVCHKCDNPPCCRPEHLFLGTPLDNARDRTRKGRSRKRGTPLVLTESDVRQIRVRRAAGETLVRIAAAFGVDHSAVWQIVHRKAWAWVE